MTDELMSESAIKSAEARVDLNIPIDIDQQRHLIDTARAAHEYKDDAEFVRRDSAAKVNFLVQQNKKLTEENEKLRKENADLAARLDEVRSANEAKCAGYVQQLNLYGHDVIRLKEQLRVARALVTALDNAFISSWQSTAGWQKELDEARKALGDAE